MWIPQLPAALSWDHNEHYHRWLLAQLPDNPERVFDAGCGSGALAVLMAGRAEFVDGADRSADMIALARARWPGASNVRWLHGDILDPELPLTSAGYDAVTALSSLHHVDLRAGLARLASLVRPGGVLAVVGLYRNATAADRAWEPVSLLANAAVGASRVARRGAGLPHPSDRPLAASQSAHASQSAQAAQPGQAAQSAQAAQTGQAAQARRGTQAAQAAQAGQAGRAGQAAQVGQAAEPQRQPYDPGLPMRAPQDSLAEIAAAARQITPGARIRRRVFWRYTLVWRRPHP
jgi:SAM-dependent methyltransferase